ncbi:MAG: triose-phosphate isomerase [Verrucomicrobia bacterium]|nr:triose-phosphate isomerase [Verrucomicrobiota bacterium]MDA1069579.1 triose-phosphate isomerase [Verrucomicrobiota bacterium]
MSDQKKHRIPIAIANWKMAMTVSQSLSFVEEFKQEMGDLIGKMQVILTAPSTVIYPLANALKDTVLVDPGAQNSSAHTDVEHSGEVSAALLADAGCVWCMCGHWEMIKRMHKDDSELNRELHAIYDAAMRPIILVGESTQDRGMPSDDLVERLETILEGITTSEIARSVMVYEPEWAIGADEPADPDYIAERATFMRKWVSNRFGEESAQQIPMIYGGAVFPENAEWLLSTPDLDGLGAGRRGRNAKSFASIAKTVGKAHGLI